MVGKEERGGREKERGEAGDGRGGHQGGGEQGAEGRGNLVESEKTTFQSFRHQLYEKYQYLWGEKCLFPKGL